jgi:nitronate monooxygenase
LALVQLLVQRTRLPVVAAGGIMDGAGIAAVLQLGACAAQMGTAFVPCPESNANAAYRQALLNKEHARTAVTSAISGRPARGLVNRLHALGAAYPGSLPAYPQVYDAGKALHQAASAQGCTDFAPFWAGQGVALARALPAAQLVQVLAAELAQA